MQSLKSQVLIYLKSRYPDYVHSGEIERYAMSLQHKAQTADRKCRELENEGKIEKSYMKTKDNRNCVIYRSVISHKVESVMEVRSNQPQML